ncbi:diguanylate cyclase (GGDEF)-like protein/PAS domain S-box-containing protein [Symbiobacterium terraclitae]|uniref:Diguanylate cyclase (GGDEF)-like protein/PAS domain S-box-containing protein n=1 Tax=Symbiobacterium terraclitae TaxID=557451 RepID=A0ABS4JV87_9FIRM|nr:EAL domain-containing protein [Symbiobacterium terraclitae]MBP2019457.1 diguanylate cyclase (GGDEF)-like protein/PAS domain S-box-containing protein [Symbiobacterium terraclitae]
MVHVRTEQLTYLAAGVLLLQGLLLYLVPDQFAGPFAGLGEAFVPALAVAFAVGSAFLFALPRMPFRGLLRTLLYVPALVPPTLLTALSIWAGWWLGACFYGGVTLALGAGPRVLHRERLLQAERERTERTLRESEARFRSAFHNAPIGVALLSADRRWLQVNRALTAMLGYTENELVGRPVDDFVHPEDRIGTDCPLAGPVPQGAAAAAGVCRRERRFRHKSGRTVWVEQTCSRIDQGPGVHYFIVQFQDTTERREAEARLRRMASRDALTGLYNRRAFQAELERHLELARKNLVRGALLFLDLDLFKFVNDTLGHLAGDQVLVRVADIIQSHLRPTDIAARHGGDEFAILMPYTGREAVSVAESILQGLQEEPIAVKDRSVTITGSVGITFFPDHGLTAETLLAQADMAMYKAKESGRNTVAVFEEEDVWRDEMAAKLSWDLRLREALRQDRFVLHAQPILDLRTGRVTRLELLLRLVGENGELTAPGEFLAGAERFGLIQEIDRWVIREAIRLMAELRRTDIEAFEVNLSAKTISDPGLARMIKEELELHQVDPSRLVLEITETAAIGDMEQARRFIATMHGLGCRFALDDVGSGFSTLHLLKHLPVDYLKIDGAFICNLPHESADQHLVRAMVAMARSQGQKTIAEFVDSEETLRLVREFGVDYAQGYLVGRPSRMWLTPQDDAPEPRTAPV